ncbi:MAG TPA: hypothetical protein PKA02_00210 [Candidatus Saccharibacteria bacterium]|nr:hypothetical protein [Candidatus Saccharibacteria bacterium]
MTKNTSRRTSRFTKKYLLIILAVLVVIAGCYLFVNARSAEVQNTTNKPARDSGTNLDPPTKEEKSETEAHKKELEQSTQPTNTSENGKKQVTPFITGADKQEISAYVSGIFEEGGTCTATLTKDGKTLTKTSKGFGNVSYTSCEPIEVSGSLENGTWSVIVSYSSGTAGGKSEAKVFTVE